jgi:hypothetical protein
MEDNREGNETQRIKFRLKLIVLRDHPHGNEIWWKISAFEMDTPQEITAEIR